MKAVALTENRVEWEICTGKETGIPNITSVLFTWKQGVDIHSLMSVSYCFNPVVRPYKYRDINLTVISIRIKIKIHIMPSEKHFQRPQINRKQQWAQNWSLRNPAHQGVQPGRVRAHTVKDRPVYELSVQSSALPDTPTQSSSRSIKMSWSAVSKADFRSNSKKNNQLTCVCY